MDTPASVKEAGQAAATTYRVYRRRWAMVATVMLLNVSNSGLGFNLAAVAYKAADYFEVTPQQITWFMQVYFLVPIVFAPISTFIFNKFGLRAGIHVGSALNCVAAVTRALATSGLVSDPFVQYAVSLSGQVAGGMGELFLAFVSTKVAQNWFPDDSRMIATTIMAFSPSFGISVAQVMAPLVVKKQQQIPTLNYAYCGLTLLAELVALVCVTRWVTRQSKCHAQSKPPTPPSRSAEQGNTARAPYLQQLKKTFTCLPFLGLLLTGGILAAIFLCFTTLSQQMLCSTGYSDVRICAFTPHKKILMSVLIIAR
ncbi:Solute carrier family 49 member A3 [Chionoecetes opilio]|uniref:Solute carrier family 49 member A3 n=1 Tax=Chionoecetes opilio TaxID=41210 RepID=A0A8J4XYV2_CHIOP|nr:Solute carrier family 49 member A3 [Chionoecetes opilio]